MTPAAHNGNALLLAYVTNRWCLEFDRKGGLMRSCKWEPPLDFADALLKVVDAPPM